MWDVKCNYYITVIILSLSLLQGSHIFVIKTVKKRSEPMIIIIIIMPASQLQCPNIERKKCTLGEEGH